MPRARALRSTVVAVLPCFFLAIGILQACGKGDGSAGGSTGASGSSAARAQSAGGQYDPCPSNRQEAPPKQFYRSGHGADFKSYLDRTGDVDFRADFHRSSRSVLLHFAQNKIDTLGWATIEPEHCSHWLNGDSDFDDGRIVSRITSTAEYTNRHTGLKFNKGVNYVVVYKDSSTPRKLMIGVFQIDLSATVPTVHEVTSKQLTRHQLTRYRIPIASFRDTIYTYPTSVGRALAEFALLENSQCGDECCGFGDGDRDHGGGDSTHTDSTHRDSVRRRNPARPESLRTKQPPARTKTPL